jgi:hypothetical protein
MESNNNSFLEKTGTYIVKYYYVIIFIVFLIISMFVRLDPLSDDLFFKTASEKYTILEFLNFRYFTWSTRFLAEGLLYIITNTPIILWWIINSASWTLLVYSILKTLPDKESKKSFSPYFIFLLVLCINISVIASSGFQITGSLNYLFAVSLGIYISIFEIKNLGIEKIPKKNNDYKFIFLPVLLFINEQVGVTVLLIFMLFYGYRFFKYKEFHTKEIFIILLSIICFIFVYLAPGSKARLNTEVINWYQSFLTISSIEKIKIFTTWLFTTLFIKMNPLFLIFGIFLSQLLLKDNKKSSFNLLASAILLLPVALALINNGLPNSQYPQLDKLFYTFDYLSVYSNFRPYLTVYSDSNAIYSATSYLFWLTYASVMILTIIKLTKLKGAFIIMAMSLSLFIFYFSPTLFASGNRILLLPSVLLILIIAPLISKASTQYKVLIFCLALLGVLFLTSFWIFNGFLSIY